MQGKQLTFRAMHRRLLARASVLALRVAMGFGLVAATVVLPAGWVKAEPYVFDIVALLGDTAPDTGGDTFTDFPVSAPVLNAAGDVAFGAVFGAAHDDGIFKESSGKLIAVALRGDTAPGTGGDTFADFVYAPPAERGGRSNVCRPLRCRQGDWHLQGGQRDAHGCGAGRQHCTGHERHVQDVWRPPGAE